MTAVWDKYISLGIDEVHKSDTGSLSLYFRYMLWTEMNSHFGVSAHRRRSILNTLVVYNCAIRAWDRQFPRNPALPRRYWDISYNFASGSLTREKARIELSATDESIGSIEGFGGYDSESSEPIGRAMAELAVPAARCGAFVSGFDEQCLKGTPPTAGDVYSEEFYTTDAHYICSIIRSNGSERDDWSVLEERRSYWMWWLTEMLPVAFGDIATAFSGIGSGKEGE